MKRRPSRNASFYIIFSCFVSHSPCAILTAGILILMVTFVDLLRGGSHDLSSPSINEIIPFLEGPGRKRFRSVVECPVVFLTRHDESLLSRGYFLRFSHVFPGGWQKRGRRGPRLKEFPPSSTVNSTIVNAFCPPPPHLRPAVSVRLNESIRRFFTCFVSPRTTFPLTSDFSPLPSFLPSFPSLFLFLCNLQRSILTLDFTRNPPRCTYFFPLLLSNSDRLSRQDSGLSRSSSCLPAVRSSGAPGRDDDGTDSRPGRTSSSTNVRPHRVPLLVFSTARSRVPDDTTTHVNGHIYEASNTPRRVNGAQSESSRTETCTYMLTLRGQRENVDTERSCWGLSAACTGARPGSFQPAAEPPPR